MIHFFAFANRFRRTTGKRRTASSERGRHRRLRMESLETRQLLSVTLPTPTTPQTVVAGDGPVNVAFNGSDSAGDAVTYTVNVVSSTLKNAAGSSTQLTTAVMPSTNSILTMTVSGTNTDGTAFSGNLVFSLFSNYVPDAVAAISKIASTYDGNQFFRVINNFMAQAGTSSNNGQGGNGTAFDDQYNSNLQFTGPGILALANSGPNTNNSQFFITSPEETTPYSSGNFRYTIIGQLISGSSILSDIMNVPVTTNSTTGFPDPNNPVTISNVSVSTDNQDGVIQFSAPTGTTGSEVVTVTATSVENGVTQTATTSQMTFNASASTYTDPPYINRPVTPIQVTAGGAAVNFTVGATDVNNNAITYATPTPSNSTMTVTAVNSAGEFSLNPNGVAPGIYSVNESATATSPASGENTAADTESSCCWRAWGWRK
jgi:cyclophilin family peptidyl-prolyl cis-trans isomerase